MCISIPFVQTSHYVFALSLLIDGSFLGLRLQFEARNQKKEAKEMAVIEAMKKRDQQEQSDAAAQTAH